MSQLTKVKPGPAHWGQLTDPLASLSYVVLSILQSKANLLVKILSVCQRHPRTKIKCLNSPILLWYTNTLSRNASLKKIFEEGCLMVYLDITSNKTNFFIVYIFLFIKITNIESIENY